ncbi:MAG: hypothetical protein GY722_22505 [bacterium]|nr:hypothetical protein [bacterium]
MDVPVFIGEQHYIDIIGTVRMRSVTFEEFAYLIGRTVYVLGFEYQKVDGGYHFGGQEAAEPRNIMDGWGIKMWRTVFRQGEQIRATIFTRGTDPIVDPRDPAFAASGSFRILDHHGRVARAYLPLSEMEPKLPMLQRKTDGSEITVAVDSAESLEPGEYTMTFRYRDHETRSIAFEVYPASKEVRSSFQRLGGGGR